MFQIRQFTKQADKPWLGYWAKSTLTGFYLRKDGQINPSTGLSMESTEDFETSGNFATKEEIRALLKENDWEEEPEVVRVRDTFKCPKCGAPHFGSFEKEQGDIVYCCHGNEWKMYHPSCGWQGPKKECFIDMTEEEYTVFEKQARSNP